MLHASVPIGEALTSLTETSTDRRFKRVVNGIRQDIDNGMALWKALDASRIVSTQTLSLVRFGEESGNLVKNLQIAAKQEEKQRVFRAKVRSAMMYPTFVLAIAVVIGLGVAWFLLPRLSATFAQLNVELPPISRAFIAVGDFLGAYGIIAVPSFLIFLFMAGYLLFAAPKTKSVGRRLLLHIPGIGKLLREVELARFGYLLGTLLDAGLTITQAFDSLISATETPSYKKLYHYLKVRFDEGYNFQASIKAYKHSQKLIPPAVQQIMIAGERSGSLPTTLLNVGEVYEEKADISTRNIEAVIEPILLVIVWLGVMLIAIAVIVPIYSLVGGVEQP